MRLIASHHIGILVASAVVLLLVSLFGPLLLLNTETVHTIHENKVAVYCPLMTNALSPCAMNALQHLAVWKALFTTLLTEIVVLLGVALMVVSFLVRPQHGSLVTYRHRRTYDRSTSTHTFTTLCLLNIISPRAP